MKHLSKLSALIIAVSLSAGALAQDVKPTHTIGLQSGGGGLEYKGKDTDGQGVGVGYLYYNYRFMPNFSFEAGLLGAEDVDDWQCDKGDNSKFTCYSDDSDDFELQADNFEFGSMILAIKGEYQLSEHNLFYAKLGAEFYGYQFDLNRDEIVDKEGTGLFVEAGWEYRWDNGMGINLALQNHDLGNLEMNSFNIGVSYAF